MLNTGDQLNPTLDHGVCMIVKKAQPVFREIWSIIVNHGVIVIVNHGVIVIVNHGVIVIVNHGVIVIVNFSEATRS